MADFDNQQEKQKRNRWLKTEDILQSHLEQANRSQNDLCQSQGISLFKRVLSTSKNDHFIGAHVIKSQDSHSANQLLVSEISAQKGAFLSASHIYTGTSSKPRNNNLFFNGSNLAIYQNVFPIRHRITSFVSIPNQRAIICYCKNELVIRGYKIDMTTGTWFEVLKMPVYPSMNDLKYCEHTDELYGASRGYLNVWKMIPLGAGKLPIPLAPLGCDAMKGETWVMGLKIQGRFICARMSRTVVIFDAEKKTLLDIVEMHHLKSPVSDMWLWFDSLHIGNSDAGTVSMIVGGMDGSISLLININAFNPIYSNLGIVLNM